MRAALTFILAGFLTVLSGLPASAQTTGAIAGPTSDKWRIGLFCESVFPDKRLNNFFLIDEDKREMLVASFNEDKVSFVQPPIILSKTPEELVNRKTGLSLNRKTLQMKWRNQKSTCHIKSVEELTTLAETHLSFLLGDNKI